MENTHQYVSHCAALSGVLDSSALYEAYAGYTKPTTTLQTRYVNPRGSCFSLQDAGMDHFWNVAPHTKRLFRTSWLCFVGASLPNTEKKAAVGGAVYRGGAAEHARTRWVGI